MPSGTPPISHRPTSPIGEPRSLLGEGPIWDAETGRILWLDIKGRKLHALERLSGRVTSVDLPFRVGSIGRAPHDWPCASAVTGEAFLCCGDRGFGWLTLGSGDVRFERIAHPEADVLGNRFNDGKIGPDGRYWAGTMDDAEQEARGTLYAFRADGGFDRVDGGYMVPNGPAFSPDGTMLYHTDSARQVIYAFELGADGVARHKRPFVTFGSGEGYPDGMTVSRNGDILVAIWDGWRIERISPAGVRLGAIAMPVARPTSCTFAGDDESELFVTSANIGLAESDGLSGALFRIDL